MSSLNSKKRISIKAKIFIGVCLFVIVNLILNILILRFSVNDIYIGLEKRELKKQYNLVKYNISNENNLINIIYDANSNGIKIKILDEALDLMYSIFSDKMDRNFTNFDLALLKSLGNKNSLLVTLKDYKNSGYDLYLVGKAENNYVILSSSVEVLKKDAKTATVVIAITSFISFLILLILAYFISKIFGKKVNEIKAVTSDISNLKFDKKLEIKSNDELGDLFSNINDMSDKLESSIKQLETANEKLKQDLIEKEKQEIARKQLIANISHEFKTPLTIISGYSQLLLDDVKSKESKESLGLIINESERLSDLVYEFLDLSKLESGAIKLKKERTNVNELIKDELKKLSVRIKDRRLKVETNFTSDENILVDKKLIIRVIDNLLTNAIKFADKGGVVKITTSCCDDDFKFSVYDSGSKIKQQDLENIFNSYYKDKSSRNKEGTGLGLTIVNAIVKLHNGSCHAKNVTDGVLFEVILKNERGT